MRITSIPGRLVPSTDTHLSKEERRRTAETLGRAFEQDPLMRYVFPDDDSRMHALSRLFGPALCCCEYYGGVETEADGAGVAAWLSGAHFPLGVRELVRSGMILTPLWVGLRTLLRLQRHEAACERLIDDRYGEDGAYAYLWSIGVAPDHHGEGLGGELVRGACMAMAADHRLCVLKTENEANVPLYEHLGFRTAHTTTVPSSDLPVWVMERRLSE